MGTVWTHPESCEGTPRAQQGGDAPSACRLAETLGSAVTMATQPPPIELGGDQLVGSHRYLNAHNVAFPATGLRVIAWETARPAWPARNGFLARRLASQSSTLAQFLDDHADDIEWPTATGRALLHGH